MLAQNQCFFLVSSAMKQGMFTDKSLVYFDIKGRARVEHSGEHGVSVLAQKVILQRQHAGNKQRITIISTKVLILW